MKNVQMTVERNIREEKVGLNVYGKK